ncbi:hypothetical protein JTE90_021960 [Oedothorax gibbosus]|uniref:Uncharacterized protein n=1 Tax=Oedothorax gibbosus TaxID=931172 RepID=A0AAV6V4I0_9ARAC|nr:hypothetical protein JTE90_021960 [Oedothorax gibbosus]
MDRITLESLVIQPDTDFFLDDNDSVVPHRPKRSLPTLGIFSCILQEVSADLRVGPPAAGGTPAGAQLPRRHLGLRRVADLLGEVQTLRGLQPAVGSRFSRGVLGQLHGPRAHLRSGLQHGRGPSKAAPQVQHPRGWEPPLPPCVTQGGTGAGIVTPPTDHQMKENLTTHEMPDQ